MTKGKSHTFKLEWVATNIEDYPDYDWCCLINDSTEAGVRQGLNGTGVVIVEDPDGLLTELTDGGPVNLTLGKTGKITVPGLDEILFKTPAMPSKKIVSDYQHLGVFTGQSAEFSVITKPYCTVPDGLPAWGGFASGDAAEANVAFNAPNLMDPVNADGTAPCAHACRAFSPPGSRERSPSIRRSTSDSRLGENVLLTAGSFLKKHASDSFDIPTGCFLGYTLS